MIVLLYCYLGEEDTYGVECATLELKRKTIVEIIRRIDEVKRRHILRMEMQADYVTPRSTKPPISGMWSSAVVSGAYASNLSVADGAWQSIAIFSDQDVHWLITDGMATSVTTLVSRKELHSLLSRELPDGWLNMQ